MTARFYFWLADRLADFTEALLDMAQDASEYLDVIAVRLDAWGIEAERES